MTSSGRRQLIQTLLTLPLLGSRLLHAGGDPWRIIVVGAGMAGLSAAQALRAAGCQVTVLEARQRIGGRIHSDRSLGVAVDLGASWIHGADGNPLLPLAKAAGARTVATDWDSLKLYQGGKEMSERAVAAAESLADDWTDGLAREVDDADASLADGLAQRQAAIADGADAATVAAARSLIASSIEIEYGEDARALSLAALDEGEEFDGDHLLLPDGYDVIPAYLARGLDIRLGQIVGKIAHNGDGARVSTARGDFDADAVLVTVPLGVLRSASIRFEPPLPADHREALAGLGMGALEKIVMRFPRQFWPDEVHEFGVVDAALPINFFPLNVIGAGPVLVAMTRGSDSRQLQTRSDQSAAGVPLAALRQAFGRSIAEPDAIVRSHWGIDPYALGSYSLVRPGGDFDLHEALARPLGPRAVLAGEATVGDYPATVHGALLSGQRAAARLLRALGED